MAGDARKPGNPFAALNALRDALPPGEATRETPKAADTPSDPVAAVLSKRVVVRRERKGRGGKTVTVVQCAEGSDEASLDALASSSFERPAIPAAHREEGAVIVGGDIDDRVAILALRARREARHARRMIDAPTGEANDDERTTVSRSPRCARSSWRSSASGARASGPSSPSRRRAFSSLRGSGARSTRRTVSRGRWPRSLSWWGDARPLIRKVKRAFLFGLFVFLLGHVAFAGRRVRGARRGVVGGARHAGGDVRPAGVRRAVAHAERAVEDEGPGDGLHGRDHRRRRPRAALGDGAGRRALLSPPWRSTSQTSRWRATAS